MKSTNQKSIRSLIDTFRHTSLKHVWSQPMTPYSEGIQRKSNNLKSNEKISPMGLITKHHV